MPHKLLPAIPGFPSKVCGSLSTLGQRCPPPTKEYYAGIQTAECLPVLKDSDFAERGARSRRGSNESAQIQTIDSLLTVCSDDQFGQWDAQEFLVRPPTSPAPARRRRNHRLNDAVPRLPAVDEALEVLEGWKWHIVHPPQSEAAAEQAAKVPEGMGGIFVMSDLRHPNWTCKLIEQIIQSNDDNENDLPIIVMILDISSGTSGIEAVLEAQRAFHSAGADDVIAKVEGCSGESLRLMILMSVLKAERRASDHEEINKWMEEQREEQAAQAKMFWSCAHRVFPGFPKMDSRANVTAQEAGPYRLQSKLGEGGFGSVYVGVNQDQTESVAVKVLLKKDLQELPKVRNVWREITCLQKLRHPCIVGFLGTLHTREHIYIHMELVGRYTLSRAIADAGAGGLPMLQVWEVGSQVASALAHCHKVGVAHRDVKPENVVLCDDEEGTGNFRIKLIDFGLACEVSHDGAGQRCGTMPYCAPELLKDFGNGMALRGLDPRALDVWSFGVVVIEMAFGAGQMCRMLDWPNVTQPTAERGEQLSAFFGNGRAWWSHSFAAKGGCPMGDELLQLLVGQLEVDGARRWTANQVETWMARQRRAI